MLHLIKLSVGTRDVDDLRAWQAARAGDEPPLRHRTRQRPKRVAELLDGGSIHWVIAGRLLVRQRLLDVIDDHWDDGTRCVGLLLDPILVELSPRPVQPFQGWRYLAAEAASPDLAAAATGLTDLSLPDEMRKQLRHLCLL